MAIDLSLGIHEVKEISLSHRRCSKFASPTKPECSALRKTVLMAAAFCSPGCDRWQAMDEIHSPIDLHHCMSGTLRAASQTNQRSGLIVCEGSRYTRLHHETIIGHRACSLAGLPS